MADTLTPLKRSELMRRVRSKHTTPEIIVRRLVYSLGYRYRLHAKRLPGQPDLVFATKKKVIFVHGCFWHRHPDPACKLVTSPKTRVRFWQSKFDANVTRDAKKERELRQSGWDVLTIWQCDLKKPDDLKSKILTFLNTD